MGLFDFLKKKREETIVDNSEPITEEELESVNNFGSLKYRTDMDPDFKHVESEPTMSSKVKDDELDSDELTMEQLTKVNNYGSGDYKKEFGIADNPTMDEYEEEQHKTR